LRFGFLLQQKVVEMDRNKVTEILDRLQQKYEEEMEEIRERFEVSVTGFFKVGIISDYANLMVIDTLFVLSFPLLPSRTHTILHEVRKHTLVWKLKM
jgi:hypothetical protein